LAHRSHRAQGSKTLEPATLDVDESRVEVTRSNA